MIEKILLVEDDAERMIVWKSEIEEVIDGDTEILTARSLDEVEQKAGSGDIAYCVLDLGLPRVFGEAPVGVDGDENCELGFEALRFICKNNPLVEVSIVSAFSDVDKVASVKSGLAMDGFPIRRVENKDNDPDYMDRIKPDVVGLDAIKASLDTVSIRAIHPLERRIARRLWKKANQYSDIWPAPIIVLRGEPRSGKDAWARAFISFIQVQRPNDDRVPEFNYDLGKLSGEYAGDSGKRDLFGSRGYGGNYPDCAGAFEKASAYVRNGRLIHELSDPGERLARPDDRVDFAASNVVWLNELGNLPRECQKLILGVLDSNPQLGGRVVPTGSQGEPIHIGCSVVFTTNANIEDNVVSSNSDVNIGEIREDLYLRLRGEPDGWVEIPSMGELGYQTFRNHLGEALKAAIGSDVDVSASTERLLSEAFERNLSSLSMQTIKTIVASYSQTRGRRLSDEHVMPALQVRASRGKHSTSLRKPKTVNNTHWGIREFEQAGKVTSTDKEYYILEYFLAKPNQTIDPEEIRAFIDEDEKLSEVRRDSDWKPYENQHALRGAVSRLRRKIGDQETLSQSNVKLKPRGFGVMLM
jgi:hypothetical protein